jgi:alanyl-tRNA synthetase
LPCLQSKFRTTLQKDAPVQSQEIRKSFLEFFQEKQHLLMPSSSLIPAADPTLLLTSAGMVQFKPYFTGEMQPPGPRLTSAQKCFRVSDVEEVGDTSHLTFFEMLGNFSIGDYFKKEAIAWAWEFITEHMKLPADRLWGTVFTDDDEAHDLWVETGIPAERIRRFDEKDNYWGPAGEEGPCGPCSEIHYDFGGECRLGKPDCECGPNCECGRFLELWNLVFMQFYQDPQGKRTPLSSPNIDTGMGLERAALILQGKTSIYDTDLFQPIVQRVCELSGKSYGQDEETDVAIRVVAEHARSAAFLIANGVVPDNKGRGYVLRRLVRRAIRFGRKLELEGFLPPVADTVIETMGKHWSELKSGQKFVLQILHQEEQQFGEVYETGIRILEEIFDTHQNADVITGKEAFLLYDTYGFPFEVTAEIAREHHMEVDMEGFEKEMDKQREKGRAAAGFGGDFDAVRVYQKMGADNTMFLGYETTTAPSVVTALVADGSSVEKVDEGRKVEIILRETPFYAEGGGQVGDKGIIEGPKGTILVEDTQSPLAGLVVHKGHVTKGSVSTGESVVATADRERRKGAARNHTATHLLHAALRQVLGTHVRQAGSLVTPDRLRFDFTHVNPMTDDELRKAEGLVNDRIRANVQVRKRETTYRQAVADGALAFFGDKYGNEVRVVEIANGEAFSYEICGGTHLNATGEVGYCHVIGESSIGAGMRRIEAVTGPAAEALVREREALLSRVSRQLEASPQDLETRVASLLNEITRLRGEASTQERISSRQQAQQLLESVKEVNGLKVASGTAGVTSVEALREVGDWLRDKLGGGIIVLGAVVNDRPTLLVMVSKDLVGRGLHAGDAVKEAAKVMGGGGGGQPEMAQAGGREPGKLEEALRKAVEVVARQAAGDTP